MVRSTVADVDLDAIAHNLKVLSDFLQAEPRPAGASVPGIVAVVKADAYGHGAVPVAKALESAGATMLACADVEEAVTLRRAGVGVDILVFGALGVSDVSGIFEYGSPLRSRRRRPVARCRRQPPRVACGFVIT